MFKTYADFSAVDPKSPDHPGQPVHCDRHFDVWPDPKNGQFFVILSTGERKEFPSIDAAKQFACADLKAQADLATAQAEVQAANAAH